MVSSRLERTPISEPVVYLLIGLALEAYGLGLLNFKGGDVFTGATYHVLETTNDLVTNLFVANKQIASSEPVVLEGL